MTTRYNQKIIVKGTGLEMVKVKGFKSATTIEFLQEISSEYESKYCARPKENELPYQFCTIIKDNVDGYKAILREIRSL